MLGSLFSRSDRQARPDPASTRQVVAPKPLPPIFDLRTPAVASGIPVYEPSALIQLHNDLLTHIRYSSGASDEDFRRYYLSAVSNFAGFVHALPASRAYHHASVGGMLRHSLEVAFFALRVSDGVFFVENDVSPAQRRADEPRWRLAVFLAALCHDLGKAVADISVTDETKRIVWNPFISSIVDWCAEHSLDAYHPEWVPQSVHGIHEALAGACIDRVVTPDHRAYLSAGDRRVLSYMMLAVTGSRIVSNNKIFDIVNKADQDSVSKDVSQGTRVVDGISIGISQPERIIQVARRFATDIWKPNIGGARYFVSDDGLFLVWPQAYEEIRAKIREEGGTSVPEDPAVAAQLLFEHGYIEPTKNDSGDETLLWKLLPIIPSSSIQVERSCVRVRNPDLIFVGTPPPSIEIRLALQPRNTTPVLDAADGSIDALSRQKGSALFSAPVPPPAPAVSPDTALTPPPTESHSPPDHHHTVDVGHAAPAPPPDDTPLGDEPDSAPAPQPPKQKPSPPKQVKSDLPQPPEAPQQTDAERMLSRAQSATGKPMTAAQAAQWFTSKGDGGNAVISILHDLTSEAPQLQIHRDVTITDGQVNVKVSALQDLLSIPSRDIGEILKASDLIELPVHNPLAFAIRFRHQGVKDVPFFRFDVSTTRKMILICPSLANYTPPLEPSSSSKTKPSSDQQQTALLDPPTTGKKSDASKRRAAIPTAIRPFFLKLLQEPLPPDGSLVLNGSVLSGSITNIAAFLKSAYGNSARPYRVVTSIKPLCRLLTPAESSALGFSAAEDNFSIDLDPPSK